MGQEFGATSPFLFFADHEPRLAELVRRGRAEHLAQFASAADPAMQTLLSDPASPQTFACSRLDPAERGRHPEAVALHRDLLALRRADPAFAAQQAPRGRALAPAALALRFARGEGGDRLLLLNLGPDLALEPEPAPPLELADGSEWRLIWSSEDPCYGGSGTPAGARLGRVMPAESALVLAATGRS